MQRFLGFILATIQALGIPLAAGLFICAVTGELRNQRLTLEWPFLIDVDYPLLEMLLLSLPSILLYAALTRVLKSRRWRAACYPACCCGGLLMYSALWCACAWPRAGRLSFNRPAYLS